MCSIIISHSQEAVDRQRQWEATMWYLSPRLIHSSRTRSIFPTFSLSLPSLQTSCHTTFRNVAILYLSAVTMWYLSPGLLHSSQRRKHQINLPYYFSLSTISTYGTQYPTCYHRHFWSLSAEFQQRGVTINLGELNFMSHHIQKQSSTTLKFNSEENSLFSIESTSSTLNSSPLMDVDAAAKH